MQRFPLFKIYSRPSADQKKGHLLHLGSKSGRYTKLHESRAGLFFSYILNSLLARHALVIRSIVSEQAAVCVCFDALFSAGFEFYVFFGADLASHSACYRKIIFFCVHAALTWDHGVHNSEQNVPLYCCLYPLHLCYALILIMLFI